MYDSAVTNGLYIFFADQCGPRAMSLAFSQSPDGSVGEVCAGREGMVLARMSREQIRNARRAETGIVTRLRPEVYGKVERVSGQ
jgi:hypothetical protein